MARRDRRLHLIRTRLAAAQGGVEQLDPFRDLVLIPTRALLLLERDQGAGVIDARKTS
jgi:hypothetical protein